MADGFDLLELGEGGLYFDEPCLPEVEALIAQAANHYGQAAAEPCLLRAYFLAPEQLSVRLGLARPRCKLMLESRLQQAQVRLIW